MANPTFPEFWDDLRAECITQGLTEEMADNLISDIHTIGDRMDTGYYEKLEDALSDLGRAFDVRVPEGIWQKLWQALYVLFVGA